MSTADLPVVVVGGGPVGLVSACLLADLGVPTVLVERQVEPHGLPRAVHLDDEAQRILDRLGVLDRLDPPPEPARTYEYRDAEGGLLFSISPRRRSPARPPSVYFHQPAAERALREAVARRPLVEARYAEAVVGVASRPAQVLARRPDGTTRTIRAAAVLACDGAASAVRRGLGVRLLDLGFDQPWLVLDVVLGAPPPGLAQLTQRCGGLRTLTSVPTGGSRHRFEIRLRPGEDGEALLASGAVARLLEDLGVDLGGAPVERTAAYTFHATCAVRWRVGDVFLLGDAAHQMPPFMGQGLGTGLRDAANLAWKLALVRRGVAADALLDTYEAERRAQALAVVRLSALLGRFITARGPAADAVRWTAGAAIRSLPPARAAAESVRPPALPGGPLVRRHGIADPAGHPLPEPLHLAGEEAGGLGSGFLLLGQGRDPLEGARRATASVWETVGARRVVVAGGHLGRWLAAHGAEVAVVRPDRVVLGVGRREDLPRLTEGLTRLLR